MSNSRPTLPPPIEEMTRVLDQFIHDGGTTTRGMVNAALTAARSTGFVLVSEDLLMEAAACIRATRNQLPDGFADALAAALRQAVSEKGTGT